ncbi:hypothetical protein JCM10295v2_002087 [Rhodotorula toruloides]
MSPLPTLTPSPTGSSHLQTQKEPVNKIESTLAELFPRLAYMPALNASERRAHLSIPRLQTGRKYFGSLRNDEDRLALLPLQKYEYAPPRADDPVNEDEPDLENARAGGSA